jgi:hypothetical protein
MAAGAAAELSVLLLHLQSRILLSLADQWFRNLVLLSRLDLVILVILSSPCLPG